MLDDGCVIQAKPAPDGAQLAVVAIESRRVQHPISFASYRVGGHLQIHSLRTGVPLLDLPDRITRQVFWAPDCTQLVACLCTQEHRCMSEWTFFGVGSGASMRMHGSWSGSPPTDSHGRLASQMWSGQTASWSPDSRHIAIVQDFHAEWICVLKAATAEVVWSTAMQPQLASSALDGYRQSTVTWTSITSSCWGILLARSPSRVDNRHNLVTLPPCQHADVPEENAMSGTAACQERKGYAYGAASHGVIASCHRAKQVHPPSVLTSGPPSASLLGQAGFQAFEFWNSKIGDGEREPCGIQLHEAADSIHSFAWAPFQLGRSAIGAYASCNAGFVCLQDETLEADSSTEPLANCYDQHICFVDGHTATKLGQVSLAELHARSGQCCACKELIMGPSWSCNGTMLAVATRNTLFVVSL